MPEFLQKILDTIAEFVTTFGFKLIGSLIVLILGIIIIKWISKLIHGNKSFKKIPRNAQTLIVNMITALLYVVLAITIALNLILEFAATAVNLFCLQTELIELSASLDILDYAKLRAPK